MNVREPLRDVENLRFRIQMNNRLRLECLAAVSKVFREFREPINDELLSSIVFALPQELISGNSRGKGPLEVMADSAGSYEMMEEGNPPEVPQEPALPPQEPALPPEEPALPPQEPGLPPQEPEPAPALPPQSPDEAPAMPPVSPLQSAIA
jgi:hypothetical protein